MSAGAATDAAAIPSNLRRDMCMKSASSQNRLPAESLTRRHWEEAERFSASAQRGPRLRSTTQMGSSLQRAMEQRPFRTPGKAPRKYEKAARSRVRRRGPDAVAAPETITTPCRQQATTHLDTVCTAVDTDAGAGPGRTQRIWSSARGTGWSRLFQK
ncbi:hypothetical protein L3i22_046310 [Actinoplanes sp. L3-i22]|nr:hypothetical protein L3i22_046310 [Actinoplanes sp. L3-i22]